MNIKENKIKTNEPKAARKKSIPEKAVKKQLGKGYDRESRIKSCKDCKGNPSTSDFTIPGFTGKKCTICFEVINYERT